MKTTIVDIPTLNDVALKAGVSTATVSRALNTPAKVSEDTRKRVNEAVDVLKYTPNFGARALAAKRTNTIGAVIPTMENAMFAQALQKVQETISSQAMTLLVASSNYDEEQEAKQIETLLARGADALLLVGAKRSQAIYDKLRARNIPYVLAWAYAQDNKHTCVGFNNEQAIGKLTSQAITLGHKNIAMIAGLIKSNERAEKRIIGVKTAMKAAGLDPDSLGEIETPYNFNAGGEAFKEVMLRTPRPTLIVCGNDVLAVGAIKQANAMGIKIPQDVSIVGFDDIEIASVVTPELTTVHVPQRQMGELAANMLVDMIRGNLDQKSIALEASIVNRDSLAAPKT